MSATHTDQSTTPLLPFSTSPWSWAGPPGNLLSLSARPKSPGSAPSRTRHRRPHEGDQQRQAAVRAAPRDAGHLLLRSRPRWFLVASIPASKGVENIVVDAASIEVNRRKRRAKSDNLDAAKLVGMLIRWHNGEKKLWAVVRVPTVDDEDRRQLHRELIELKAGRTEIVNRIKGLLAGLGFRSPSTTSFL